MLANYLLEELVTFARCGTLAETAAALHVTQPTVTRGMQKLETELGVPLFIRQPNRLSLTPTGELAAREAERLLQANDQAVHRIQNFARSQQTLTVTSTLPGALIVLDALRDQLPAQVQWPTHALTTDPLVALTTYAAGLVFTNVPLSGPTVTAQRVGTERLAVNLNQFMSQANQPSITFAQLKDLSFVVLDDIGPWRAIIQQHIPNAKFFYQEQRDALAAITQFSDFPYFNTNITPLDPTPAQATSADNRRRLPITDAAAQMPVYANYLTNEATRVQPVIDQVIAIWPE
ncbi:LysR family transcriptional regulator [Levilactobacillus suantsaiihabitans]|uniref:LysR family transcriptional regulator n=1 Tax=Levilactobacillus suantsaiihabitans TaxID=2487722 RepID=A0A4Z0JDQ2_9LACO|nr:LysR family transcriptional regulator [Levilactobacillus suantsaiihabitans]TGD20443.1 LysR family transcriptional regulator [Levilactobacillus suantsaiihabitans]